MKALREEEIEAKRNPETEAGQSRTEDRGSANFSKKKKLSKKTFAKNLNPYKKPSSLSNIK